jgi:hypothetical protein
MTESIGVRQFSVRLGLLLVGLMWPIVANADQRFHAILTGPQQVPASVPSRRASAR